MDPNFYFHMSTNLNEEKPMETSVQNISRMHISYKKGIKSEKRK